MKQIITKLALLISVFFTTTALAADGTTQEYHLDNGLTLIVKEDHRAPVVMSEVWYKIGSGYEQLGTTGISHMLEHMMYQGTPTHPGNAYLQLISQTGGQPNAFTTRDFTAYYAMLSADKLSLSFELESDRMAHLSLNPQNFQSEHKVVEEERQLRTVNDPEALTYERFNAVALPGNPYQNPVVGWPSDLAHMTVKDAQHWYHHWYGPNNAILIVVGDVMPDKVYNLAKQYFGPLKPIKIPVVKPHNLLKPNGPRKVIVKAPAKLPVIFIGFNTPSVVTATNKWEPYALDVLSYILGGSNSSRLQKDLVRDKQIVDDIDVNYDIYTRLPGLLVIDAEPAQRHSPNEVHDAIFNEIAQLQTTPVSGQELERVKTQVIARNIFAQDSIDSEAQLIGMLASVGLPWQEIDNYQQQIRQITPAQIQAVAKKYLILDNSTTAFLKPLPTSNNAVATMAPTGDINHVQ